MQTIEMWREIKKIIDRKSNFLITTHVNPDADGIGSATALIELLNMMGKRSCFVCDSPIPHKFRFLDFHGLHRHHRDENDYSETEVLLIVDTHQIARIGKLAFLYDKPNIMTICIDHHQITEDLAIPHCAVDPIASSTGSLVYTLFKECGYDLNREAAFGLYTSIVCDTGRFCYSSTDRKAHKIAEECIKKGVDPDWMYARLFRQVTLPRLKALAKVLETTEVHCNDRVIVQQMKQQDSDTSDVEYIHELNKLVKGIDCIVLLRELSGGRIRISLRSNSDVAIDQLIRVLGGGGHQKAAGATITGSLDEVKGRVLRLLERELDHSIQATSKF